MRTPVEKFYLLGKEVTDEFILDTRWKRFKYWIRYYSRLRNVMAAIKFRYYSKLANTLSRIRYKLFRNKKT
jgi:hypothetical protein